MKPRIGISAYPKVYDTVVGPDLLHTISCHYVDSVRRAGGVPVVLATVDPDDVGDLLDGVHGLLLSGGGDVDPARYGEEARPEVDRVDPARDDFEMGLARAALDRGLPLLAICRGMQVLNVALGGSLVQHVPAVTGENHSRSDRWAEPVHEVAVAPDSRLAEVVGAAGRPADRLAVNSMHHQAVGRPGPGLRPVAWADDGTVEAVELDGNPHVTAVQWHPELLADDEHHQALFRTLVAQALAFAAPERVT